MASATSAPAPAPAPASAPAPAPGRLALTGNSEDHMTRQGALNAMHEHIKSSWTAIPETQAKSAAERDIRAATSLAHLEDMYYRAAAGDGNGVGYSEGKVMRWLGYVQGVLVCRGIISLEQAKDCSRRHKDDV